MISTKNINLYLAQGETVHRAHHPHRRSILAKLNIITAETHVVVNVRTASRGHNLRQDAALQLGLTVVITGKNVRKIESKYVNVHCRNNWVQLYLLRYKL